jgi:hypothetical protein
MTHVNEGQSVTASDALGRKAERFQRVAPSRVDKVVKAMNVLGRCGNRLVYDYTDEHVDKMFAYLDECLKNMKAKFKQKEKESCPKFEF